MWEVMVAERLKDGLADALARSPAAAYSQAIMTAIVCRASAIIAAAAQAAIIAAHTAVAAIRIGSITNRNDNRVAVQLHLKA